MTLKHATRRRLTRAERIEDTKQRILAAAIEVVGRLGYSGSSVALITQQAMVAQGTFYNYFESRQDLLDQLLPHLGGKLLEFIRERLVDITDNFERERVGFIAFFEFVRKYPSFYRIFHEAEIFAPAGYESHMANMARGYMRALSRSLREGQISGYSERELELITFILLAARDFVGKRYTQGPDGIAVPPEWVIEAYMKFLSSGLMRQPFTPPTAPRPVETVRAGAEPASLTHEVIGERAVVARATLGPEDCARTGTLLAQIGEYAATLAVDAAGSGRRLESSSLSVVRRIEPGSLVVEAHGSVGSGVRTTASLVFTQRGEVVAYSTIGFDGSN